MNPTAAGLRTDLLAAVRGVNRLIVSEADPQRLIDKACDLLTRNLSFHNAWILLEENEQTESAVSHVPGGPEGLLEVVKSVPMTCLQRVRRARGLVVIGEPSHDCPDCPMARDYEGRVGFAGRLEHGDRRFGALVVSVPSDVADDVAVQGVFSEVLEDLGFALARLEERQRTEDERRANLELLAALREQSDPTTALPRFERLVSEALGGARARAVLGPAPEPKLDLEARAWTVPIESLGEVVGGLWVEAVPRGRLDERARSFVQVLSGHVAAAVARATTARRLAASEAWLRSVLTVAPVGIAVMRNREVLSANEACLALVGYTEAELVGASARKLYFDDASFEAVGEVVGRKLESSATARFEATWRHADGHALRVSVHVTRIDNGDEDAAFASTIVDITESRRRESIQKARLQFLEALTSRMSTLQLVETLLSQLVSLTESASGLVAMVSEEGRIDVLARCGGLASATVDIEPHGALARAARLGQVCTNDDAGSTRLAVPLIRAGRPVAVFTVGGRTRSYDSSDAATVAELGATLWENVRRREAEDAYREAEVRYRMLFDNLAAGVAIYKPLEDGDFRIVDINEVACRLGGRRAHEVLGSRVTVAFPGISEMGLLDVLRDVAKNRKPVKHPSTLYQDGRVALYLENTVFALPSGLVVALFEDKSVGHRAEAERKRLIRAIEQTKECVIILDAFGVIEYVNPAFEKVAGRSRADVLGVNVEAVRAPRPGEPQYEALRRTLEAGKTWSGRLEQPHATDGTYFEEAVISPVRDATGRVVNFVCVARDVTQDLAVEAELRQAQKMEAIGQLTGGIAHDFNNLLQIVNGSADLARLDLDAGHPALESVEAIFAAGARAAELVRELLIFSHRHVVEQTALVLDAEVARHLAALESVIGAAVELVWHPGAAARRVRADQGLVEQALVSLCSNAAQAMPQGGTLTVRSDVVDLADEDLTAAPWTRPAAYVRLALEDTGVGMDAATLEHVFEPFFTTQPMGRRPGLGLATVYGIMRQHDGLVRAESTLGVGTRFELLFPLHETTTSGRPVAAVAETAASGAHRILVAEDEPAVRHVTRRMLEREGYSVVLAVDGLDAVEKFNAMRRELDLVILDVIMPQLTGFEVYARIREIDASIPIFFASGYSEEALLGEQPSAGAPIISKPFDREALIAMVESALPRTD